MIIDQQRLKKKTKTPYATRTRSYTILEQKDP